jgi:hypothetical protein
MSQIVPKHRFEESKPAFIEPFYGIQYSKWQPMTTIEVESAKESPFTLKNPPSVLDATFYPVKATN